MCENKYRWLWLLGLPFKWVRNNRCLSCRGFFGRDPAACLHDGPVSMDNECQLCGTIISHADQLTPNHPRRLYLEGVHILLSLRGDHRADTEALGRILHRLYIETQPKSPPVYSSNAKPQQLVLRLQSPCAMVAVKDALATADPQFQIHSDTHPLFLYVTTTCPVPRLREMQGVIRVLSPESKFAFPSEFQ